MREAEKGLTLYSILIVNISKGEATKMMPWGSSMLSIVLSFSIIGRKFLAKRVTSAKQLIRQRNLFTAISEPSAFGYTCAMGKSDLGFW